MVERSKRAPAPRFGAAPPADVRLTLAAALRQRLPERSWSDVRRLCETGKVRLNGAIAIDPAVRVDAAADLLIDMSAPRPRVQVPGFSVAFEDAHLIVIEKPGGISSVPYERRETGTALDLIRDHWRGEHRKRPTAIPLYTVHRLDKETSGLLCFAKNRAAERGLHQIFQRHLATRAYLAVAHGAVKPGRIESRLLPDRGDGLRGSARDPRDLSQGQHAITHVEVITQLSAAAGRATYCRVRLETGRTHQIRIHLAEAGHPIVGDAVYTRDLVSAGHTPLPCDRMMLHANTLGFDHPVTRERIDLVSEPPEDFTRCLARLGFPRPAS